MKLSFIEVLEARIAPATVYVVEAATNKLVSFDSASPGVLKSDTPITGLQANEVVAALDFQPSTGKLFALGLVDDDTTRTGRLYTIDPITAVATQVGNAPFSTTLADTDRYGFDFEPRLDYIRVTNDLDANFRLFLPSGTFNANTALDQAGAAEAITAVAYDRNFGGDATTLYGYNFSTDNLVRIGDLNGTPDPASNGVVTPIAHVTLNGANVIFGSSLIGFDIGGPFGRPDVGWLGARPSGTTVTHLYQVNLATAELTDLGAIGDGSRNFGGLTIDPYAAPPAISADGKTANWTDIDGDLVTLKITKGKLAAGNFRMVAGSSGSALSKLTLDAAFSGTNLTFTVKRGPGGGGDRAVNIGAIEATGVDLGAVIVPGDLVRITAGAVAEPAPSVKSLTVGSLAAYGLGPLSSSDSLFSSLADGAGKIAIAGDESGGINLGKGKTGSLTIGGDVVSGLNSANIVNDAATGSLGKLVIKGSLRPLGFGNNAQVTPKRVGSVFIGGSILGGDGNASGYLSISGNGKTVVTIAGSVIGGTNVGSGLVNISDVAALKIGGSLIGGDGSNSGSIKVAGAASIAIKGDVLGGDGAFSGYITGGNGAADIIRSLAIGGSVISRDKPLQFEAVRFGGISIGGSVIGSAAAPVQIVASGIANPASVAESIAIGKVTVRGDFKFGLIAAGLKGNLTANTVEAAIGSISIGKNMITSSIAAGIDPVNGAFGDGDDKFVGGNSGAASIVAKIARITIGGQLFGTAGGLPDSFGIEAEQIGALAVAKAAIAVDPGKVDKALGFTADIRLREL